MADEAPVENDGEAKEATHGLECGMKSMMMNMVKSMVKADSLGISKFIITEGITKLADEEVDRKKQFATDLKESLLLALDRSEEVKEGEEKKEECLGCEIYKHTTSAMLASYLALLLPLKSDDNPMVKVVKSMGCK